LTKWGSAQDRKLITLACKKRDQGGWNEIQKRSGAIKKARTFASEHFPIDN
jgi:hypothetical protein